MLPLRVVAPLAPAALGAILVLLALWMPWYAIDTDAVFRAVGAPSWLQAPAVPTFDAWESMKNRDIVMAAAAGLTLVVVALVVRDALAGHASGSADPRLGWIASLGGVIVVAVVFSLVRKPGGEASELLSIGHGAWVALAGGVLVALTKPLAPTIAQRFGDGAVTAPAFATPTFDEVAETPAASAPVAPPVASTAATPAETLVAVHSEPVAGEPDGPSFARADADAHVPVDAAPTPVLDPSPSSPAMSDHHTESPTESAPSAPRPRRTESVGPPTSGSRPTAAAPESAPAKKRMFERKKAAALPEHTAAPVADGESDAGEDTPKRGLFGIGGGKKTPKAEAVEPVAAEVDLPEAAPADASTSTPKRGLFGIGGEKRPKAAVAEPSVAEADLPEAAPAEAPKPKRGLFGIGGLKKPKAAGADTPVSDSEKGTAKRGLFGLGGGKDEATDAPEEPAVDGPVVAVTPSLTVVADPEPLTETETEVGTDVAGEAPPAETAAPALDVPAADDASPVDIVDDVPALALAEPAEDRPTPVPSVEAEGDAPAPDSLAWAWDASAPAASSEVVNDDDAPTADVSRVSEPEPAVTENADAEPEITVAAEAASEVSADDAAARVAAEGPAWSWDESPVTAPTAAAEETADEEPVADAAPAASEQPETGESLPAWAVETPPAPAADDDVAAPAEAAESDLAEVIDAVEADAPLEAMPAQAPWPPRPAAVETRAPAEDVTAGAVPAQAPWPPRPVEAEEATPETSAEPVAGATPPSLAAQIGADDADAHEPQPLQHLVRRALDGTERAEDALPLRGTPLLDAQADAVADATEKAPQRLRPIAGESETDDADVPRLRSRPVDAFRVDVDVDVEEAS